MIEKMYTTDRQLFLWIGKANIVTFEEINKWNEKRHDDGFIQLNLFYYQLKILKTIFDQNTLSFKEQGYV